jgi:mono/diheme cytochrome c family protein
MGRVVLNIVLLVVFVASLGLNWAVRSKPSQPNFEFIPEMVRTPRYNAYSANPIFPDGKTLQTPEPGTIARGFRLSHFVATPEDALRAGDTLVNPVPVNDDGAIARGKVVFANFCTPCHGVTGNGDGLVVQRGYPAPPSLYAENARKIRDGQIFHILSYGQKNMPSYASQISREDRWNVIAYVRSIQMQATPAATGGQP